MSSEFPPHEGDAGAPNPDPAPDSPGPMDALPWSPPDPEFVGQSGPDTNSPNPNMGPDVLGTTVGVFFSWLIILGLTSFIFVSTTYIQFFMVPDDRPQDISKAELMPLNLQGKMLLGTKIIFGEQLAGAGGDDDTMKNQIALLNTGPPESRYGAAILMNEFADASTAIEQLDEVDKLIEILDYDSTEKQARLREIVGALLDQYELNDYDSDTIPEDDRKFLMQELGWVGELALVPARTPHKQFRDRVEEEAKKSLIIGWSAFAAGILALLAGVVVAFVFFVMSASGNLHPTFRPASARGRVYGETFAIWFMLFWGSQFAVAVVGKGFLTDVQAMAATLVVFFASLFVLIWPVARGIPFSVVRNDIGWKLRNPIIESACGFVAYLSVLPFLACSMIVVILLMLGTAAFQQNPDNNELSSVTSAGHPIQEQFAAGDPAMMACVFLALCVAAPIVEETMFRGVLYHHLRNATNSWLRVSSILFSAVVGSLIFAAVHPQGIIGIPLLATLAMGFSWVREWRGSLIAPMVMHAINNGCVAFVLFLIL